VKCILTQIGTASRACVGKHRCEIHALTGDRCYRGAVNGTDQLLARIAAIDPAVAREILKFHSVFPIPYMQRHLPASASKIHKK